MLRADGTCWLVLGDCYATGAGRVGQHPGGGAQGARWPGPMTQPNRLPQPGLKPKDLVGLPWRVALALQADGWWLRASIVWAKGVSFCPGWSGGVMPESVRDRPTRAHEVVFLLTRQESYYYDADAIREPLAASSLRRVSQRGFDEQTGGRKDGLNPNRSARRALESLARRVKTALTPHAGGQRQALHLGGAHAFHPLGRNVRDVWAIQIRPLDETHYAAFPEALVRPCIQAGTSEWGACRACGAPWRRVVRRPTGQLIGWTPGCRCRGQRGQTAPCVVLDPFAGSGTTLAVARALGRQAVGVELNPDYVAMAARRAGVAVDGRGEARSVSALVSLYLRR